MAEFWNRTGSEVEGDGQLVQGKAGPADIDAIRELTYSYREMDNRLGGGKLRSAVVS